MRELIITCDGCKRVYEYKEIQASDKYPQPTQRILHKEFCRECCKKAFNIK